jgi:hypothetical protein
MIGERVDPRISAREALRGLVHDASCWPTPSPTVLRNLLMDACGGDIKPWAMLLLAAQSHGYVDRIAGLPASPRDAWERLRTHLVVEWVSEGFLQRDAALWAVESWAYALDVIAVDQVTIPPTRRTSAPVAGPTTSGLALPRPVPAPASARLRTPPSMAAAPRRTVARPVPPPLPVPRPALSRSIGSRWSMRLALGTAVTIPLLAAAIASIRGFGSDRQRPEVTADVASITSAAASGVAMDTSPSVDDAVLRGDTVPVAQTTAPRVTVPFPLEPPDPAANAPRVAVPDPRGEPAAAPQVGQVGVTSITRNALPQSAADSARTLYVRPPTRAPGMSNGLPRGAIPLTGAIAAVPTLDEVHLRSGRVLRGRVEVIRASIVVFRDVDDNLRFEFPKTDIAAIHTEIGTIVQFDRAGAPLSAKRGSLVARGVAGDYLVSYRLRSVRGSADCRGLWQRPLTADRVSVSHQAGADTLVIAFAGGDQFPSVMDADANFASTFRIMPDQARQSTALTTRLNGRFTAAGFDGEINVLAYKRARTGDDTACHSILDMRGIRADATAGALPKASARRTAPAR